MAASKWEPDATFPDDIEFPDLRALVAQDEQWKSFALVGEYFYVTPDAQLQGVRVLLSKQDQRVSICAMYGQGEWRLCRNMRKSPYPLYNLDNLSKKETRAKDVWLFASEEEAEVARDLFADDAVASCWQSPDGSVKGLSSSDLSPLEGRHVILWLRKEFMPEAKKAKKTLAQYNCRVSVVNAPEKSPKGWTIQDAANSLSRDAVMKLVSEIGANDDNPRRYAFSREAKDFPFRCLGYDHGTYYYQSHAQNQVIEIEGRGHTKGTLLSLAPLQFWEMKFPTKGGADWTVAHDALIRMQEAAGPYNPTKVRGRGVWIDKGRIIVHEGNMLSVDGKPVLLTQIDSDYIYEARPHMQIAARDALTQEEAAKLEAAVDLLNWSRAIYSYYYTGWLMIATICGGLSWRSSIWLTGQAGSGKSWINEHIVRPLLGHNMLYALGESTEAGIRQSLKYDAIPVVIDEAEQNNEAKQRHIDAILALMRQASSETGASIYKGSTSGKATDFKIKSAFCFASVGVGVKHYADESRVSVLTLEKRGDSVAQMRFATLSATVADLLTDEYCERWRARAQCMLPVILESASIFSDAIAAHLKSRRLGDQAGVLLAGYWATQADEPIDDSAAQAIVESLDWGGEEVFDSATDHSKCINAIMTALVEVRGEGVSVKMSVAELIELAANYEYSASVTSSLADEHLRRIGIKTENDHVVIANSHSWLERALKGTPWASNYGRQLKRLEGAEPSGKIRFSTLSSSRGTKIPLSLFGIEQDKGKAQDDEELTEQPAATPPF